MSLDLKILGPLEAWRDGQLLTIPGHKARILLMSLLVHSGAPVSRDRLIDAIWGDAPPSSAVNTLHTYVTHLRDSLDGSRDGIESSVISTHPAGYRLDLNEQEVDSWRLERAVTESRLLLDRREFRATAETLATALAEWRGPPLEEFVDSEFARTEATRLEDLKISAEEMRSTALIESGENARAVEILEPLVVEHPYRERLWEHLMLALYREGRQRDALNAYQELARVLAEIGLEPGFDAAELESRILEKDPSLLPREGEAAAETTVTGIPHPANSFVGRTTELAELSELVEQSRFVTLTGIGGIGKSRLALSLAEKLMSTVHLEGRYTDLQAVSDPDVAQSRIAESFGLSEQIGSSPLQQVATLAGSERILLVIDNAEEAAPGIGPPLEELLMSCHGLHLVVTSREPLRVGSEQTFAVGPLGTDDVLSEATALFLERARIGTAAGGPDRDGVTAICRTVGGIPAAIEIAAAATKVLSLSEVADNLETLIDSDQERQGLRAVLEWTYQGLSSNQQALFATASLFPGGFTFDAASRVVESPSDLGSLLADIGGLIDRSLVTIEKGTPSRYRVLEVFRGFAMTWSGQVGGFDAICERFVGYFADLATELEHSFGSEDWKRLLARVDDEEANLSRAIEVALEGSRVDDAYRIAGPLGRYWRWRGRSGEGLATLQKVLRHPISDRGLRAKVERETSATLRVLGNFDESRSRALTALELYTSTHNEKGKADALYDLALAAIFSGDFEEAAESLDASASIWKDLGERRLAAFPMIPLAWLKVVHGEYDTAEAMWTSILTNVDTALFPEQSGITFRVAELALAQGQTDRARAIVDEALASAIEARYPYHEAGARVVLARIHMERGDLVEARAEAATALTAAQEGGNVEGAAQALLLLSRIAAWSEEIPEALRLLHRFSLTAGHIGGSMTRAVLAESAATIEMSRKNYREAAELHGIAHEIRSERHLPLGQLDRAQVEREIDTLEAEIGNDELTERLNAGRRWAEDDVVDRVSGWFE